MKHVMKIFTLLISLSFGYASAEYVHLFGDFTESDPAADVPVLGDVHVVDGNVVWAGSTLFIDGDLKVTSGYVAVSGGDLIVNGDLLVTNTKPSSDDSSVVVDGNLSVGGSIVTKSVHGRAYVITTGNFQAGRILTSGYGNSDVASGNGIIVSGQIVAKSQNSDARVVAGNGGICADSISTYSPGGDGYVEVQNGKCVVDGSITTNARDSAYVDVDEMLEAGSIMTRGLDDAAFVQGGGIKVLGDIRTYSLNEDAYVRSPVDITAQNIYTRGPANVYVSSLDGNIKVFGDIVAWQTEGAGKSAGAYRNGLTGAAVVVGDPGFPSVSRDVVKKIPSRQPSVSSGFLEAQNVILHGESYAYLATENGIKVHGDIITNGGIYGYVYSEGDIASGNIWTHGDQIAVVESDGGGIDVDHVISTNSAGQPGLDAYVAASGAIRAEKIFTFGMGDAYVASINSNVSVDGPITTYGSTGDVTGRGISAGSIYTRGGSSAFVYAPSFSINVKEDIRTFSNGYAFVSASNGDVSARSIRMAGGQEAIYSAPGSGNFQWYLKNTIGPLVEVYNSEFNLDSDLVWDNILSLNGTCTIDGNDFTFNFTTDGQIIVNSDSTLLLKNINLNNFAGTAVRCVDNTSTISFQDVTFSLTDDTVFSNGIMHMIGDLKVSGTGGTVFTYESSATSTIGAHATLLFDRGMTFSYATDDPLRIGFVDETSRFHFVGADLYAKEDLRLVRGTFVFDDLVTMFADEGKTLYIGNGVAEDDLHFAYGEMAKLSLDGTIEYDNVGIVSAP